MVCPVGTNTPPVGLITLVALAFVWFAPVMSVYENVVSLYFRYYMDAWEGDLPMSPSGPTPYVEW